MRARLGLGLAMLCVIACSQDDDALQDHRLYSMGTWVELRLPAAAIRAEPTLLTEIEDLLRQFEHDYYAWGDGELARLNQALANSEVFDASAEMTALLLQAQRFSAASAGVFDPGIGALVELWGFNAPIEEAREPPSPISLAALRARSGSIVDLRIDGNQISTDAAVLTLDLGGIAKGEAVDRIVDLLVARDISPAIVNAGGDLRVIGEPADRAWRIGIQAPRGEGLLGTITLENGESAFTSGDYERYFEHQGARLHHIIDPQTGYPVAHTQAVTVLADDGLTADAAATALFVAGPAQWLNVAERFGIDAALRVDESGEIQMTAAMRERIQINADLTSDIMVLGN